MSKLLNAELHRLFKSKLFWVCLLFLTLRSSYYVCSGIFNSNVRELGVTVLYKHNFWCNIDFFSIIMMVFNGIFNGTEYNNRTINNKIIAGYTKANIYLTQCIITGIVACIMLVVPYFVTTVIGFILIGPPNITIAQYFYDLLCGCFAACAIMLIAQFILISVCSRTKSLVIGFFVSFAALLLSGYCGYNLEYHLVEGRQKMICEYCMHIIPTGYLDEIRGGYIWLECDHTAPVFMLLIILISVIYGIRVIPKKDLK